MSEQERRQPLIAGLAVAGLAAAMFGGTYHAPTDFHRGANHKPVKPKKPRKFKGSKAAKKANRR